MPGNPGRAPSVPGKKAQARSRPRCSGSAANREGVSPGGADVAPSKGSVRSGWTPGTPRLGCPPGRAVWRVEGGRGCAKPQRLLLSSCGPGLSSFCLRVLPEVKAQVGSWLSSPQKAVLLGVQTSRAEAEPAAAANCLQPRLLCRSPRGGKPSLYEEEGHGGSAHGHGKKRVFRYLPLPCT